MRRCDPDDRPTLPSNVLPFERGRSRAVELRASVTADRTLTPITKRRGRATRPAARTGEMTFMHASHFGLSQIHAESRQRDLLAEAEQARRLHQAEATTGRPRAVLAVIRQAVGTTLVRAGERLQGAGPDQPADAYPTVATLRTAR